MPTSYSSRPSYVEMAAKPILAAPPTPLQPVLTPSASISGIPDSTIVEMSPIASPYGMF